MQSQTLSTYLLAMTTCQSSSATARYCLVVHVMLIQAPLAQAINKQGMQEPAVRRLSNTDKNPNRCAALGSCCSQQLAAGITCAFEHHFSRKLSWAP